MPGRRADRADVQQQVGHQGIRSEDSHDHPGHPRRRYDHRDRQAHHGAGRHPAVGHLHRDCSGRAAGHLPAEACPTGRRYRQVPRRRTATGCLPPGGHHGGSHGGDTDRAGEHGQPQGVPRAGLPGRPRRLVALPLVPGRQREHQNRGRHRPRLAGPVGPGRPPRRAEEQPGQHEARPDRRTDRPRRDAQRRRPDRTHRRRVVRRLRLAEPPDHDLGPSDHPRRRCTERQRSATDLGHRSAYRRAATGNRRCVDQQHRQS